MKINQRLFDNSYPIELDNSWEKMTIPAYVLENDKEFEKFIFELREAREKYLERIN